MPEVVIVDTPENEPDPTPEPVIETSLAEKVGFLEAKVIELDSKIDGKANTEHEHFEYAKHSDLLDCETRIVGTVESMVTTPEPTPEPELEPTPEPETEPTPDEPPKSRQKRKSFADRYYGNG